MTRLLLVRHGSTAWNLERRYQGQSDPSLNKAGCEQAQRVAERLRSEEIDGLYTSNLTRAQETAERIAAYHDLVSQPEPRLREISFGAWEGKTHEEIEAQGSESLAHWLNDPMHNSPPGGETLRQVVSRISAAYDAIIDRHPGDTVAVVAHGGTLRVLLCVALGLRPDTYWQFRFDVASLAEVNTYDEGAVLNLLNDTAHLQRRRPKPSSSVDETSAATTSGEKLILVLGGARSGKSDFAQRMAQEISVSQGSTQTPVLFVATAEAGDQEMATRIERHRRARPGHWHTLEAPRNVGQSIRDCAAEHRFGAVLVDCMTLLTSNLLMDAEDLSADQIEATLTSEIEALIACAEDLPSPIVVVSNEVGWGLVPGHRLGRVYRDLLGRANQALAAAADRVILLVAGIPKVIKGHSYQP